MENKNLRAGRYLQQSTGYFAFIPRSLPPVPPVELSGQLRKLLYSADYALGRLDEAIMTLPNPDLLVFMYVRKKTVFFGQNQTSPIWCTLQEAALVPPPMQDVHQLPCCQFEKTLI